MFLSVDWIITSCPQSWVVDSWYVLCPLYVICVLVSAWWLVAMLGILEHLSDIEWVSSQLSPLNHLMSRYRWSMWWQGPDYLKTSFRFTKTICILVFCLCIIIFIYRSRSLTPDIVMCATLSQFIDNSQRFYLDSHIPLFLLLIFLRGTCGLYYGHVEIIFVAD